MAFTHTVRFNPNLIELTDAIDKTTTVNYSKIYNNEITGYPSLPIKYLKFILPQDSKVEDISINSTSYTFANDIIVTSGLQKNMDGSESISKPNNDIYHQNTPYPEHQAELKEHTNYDGNVRVVTIAFYPIQYVPGLKQLIFNEEIEIELNYSNSLPAHVNPIYSYTHHIEENKAFLNSIIANNNDIEAYYPPRIGLDISTSEQPDLIIIGKASLEDSFGRYIEWKKQKGYRVAYKTIESIEASYTGDDVCLYPINDTPGKIRQYLREKKNNTPLEYVLIVGGLEDDSDNQSSTNNNATNPTVRYSVAGNFDSVYAWRNMGKDFPSIVDKGRKNQAGSDHYFANLSDDWNSFIEPPWHQIDSPYTDGDFYGTYHDTITTGIDLKVGRLIANRENQVHNFTDKVIKYETYNHPNNFNTIGHINYNQFQTPSAPGNWVLNEDPLPNHGSIEDFYQNSFNSNLTIISGSAFAWKCLHLLNNTIIKSYSDDSYIGLPTCNLNNGYGFDSISELSHGILAFTASHCDGSFFQTGNNGTGQDHVDLLTGKRSFVEAWTCSFSGQGGPVAIASSGSMFFPTQYPPNLTPDKTARQNLVNNFTSSSNLHNVFSLFKSDLYVYDMNIANIVRTLNYYGDPVLRTWVNTPILYSIQLNPYNYSINLVDENNNPAAHVKTVFLTDNSSQIITETNPSGCAFANQPFRSVTISGDNVIPITVRIIGNYTELSGDLDSNTIYYIPSGNTVSISSDLNLKGKGHFGSQIIVAEGATLSISNNVIINGELKSSPNKRGNSIYIFGNLNIGSNVVFTGEMDNMVLNNTGHNAFNAVSFEGVTLENYSNLSLLNSSFSQASLIHNSGNLTLNNVSGYESNGIGLHITKADSVLINNTNFVSNKIGASINNIRAVLNISNSNFSYNDLGIEISNTQYYCSNINNSTFSNNEYVGLRLYNAGINLVSSTITNNGTGINAYKSILMTNTTQGNPNNLISNNTHEEVLYCKASVLSLGYNRIVDNNYQTNTRDQYLIYNVDQTDDYFSIKNIFWGRDTNNQLIQPSTNRYAPQIFGDNDNIMPLYDYNLTINPPTNPEIRTLYENAIGLFNENENAQSQSMMYSIIEDYPDSDYAILATKSLLELYDLNEEEISELQYQYQNNQIFKVSPKLQKNAQNMKTEAFLMLSDYDSAIEDYLNLIAYPQTVTDSIFANIDIAYTLLLQEESGQKSPQSLSMQGLKPKNINEFYQTRNKYLSYLFNSNDEKDNETPSIPTSFLLSQNYPNPFNPETTISFDMPIEEHISLEIYNIKGQKVKTLVNEKLVPGRYILKWNGTDQYNKPVSSGIYFYKLKSASFTATKKMTLMK